MAWFIHQLCLICFSGYDSADLLASDHPSLQDLFLIVIFFLTIFLPNWSTPALLMHPPPPIDFLELPVAQNRKAPWSLEYWLCAVAHCTAPCSGFFFRLRQENKHALRNLILWRCQRMLGSLIILYSLQKMRAIADFTARGKAVALLLLVNKAKY